LAQGRVGGGQRVCAAMADAEEAGASPMKATLPSVPCSRMPKKQARILAAGDAALVQGVEPHERTRVLLEAMIRRKEERCGRSRCPRCWFPVNSSGTSYCVCPRMPSLTFRTRSRFLVYMHPRDWYNAGDDAKILLNAAPDSTDVFVFGRPGDSERLQRAIAGSDAALLLFPDEAALTTDEFIEQHRGRVQSGLPRGDAVSVAAGAPHCDGSELSIIVIDGTWNNVKQLLKHFVREVGPGVPHVRLKPTTLSVYARTQTRADGVSSVEAIALLLQELGESEQVCSELVRYIEINNEALRLQPPPDRDVDGGEL